MNVDNDDNVDLTLKTDLILVCCHSVYTGDGTSLSASNWHLAPFQRADPTQSKPSEHETFLLHIHAAAQTASHNPATTLTMFSGGPTNPSTTRSEAAGYALILSHLLPTPQIHYATEPHATDSYQNLLFSIIRFRQLCGHYPSQITVITHAFKEARFLELHSPAIKWPEGRLRVMGIDPPFSRAERVEVAEGERVRGLEPFVRDPYGVGQVLGGKRVGRGWDERVVSEGLVRGVEEVVRRLVLWKGGVDGREAFGERLPWEDAE